VRRIAQVVLLVGGWVALLAACVLGIAQGHWFLMLGVLALVTLAVWLVDAFVPALSPFTLRRGRRAILGPPRVALTFDDGPSEDTPAVLAALAREGIRATFFMLGRHVEEHPEVARAVVAAGHAVGNHTYSHRVLSLCSGKTVAEEIERTETLLKALGARNVKLFRAPRGFQGPHVRRVLRDRAMWLIGWTRGAWDSEPRPVNQIASAAAHDPKDGDILLLHDGAGTTGWQRRDHTAAAIPDIVKAYKARGFRFVTVLEMLNDGRAPA
jgi:peptidoglycan/xylan/chitin deacetylase (PgdA/CDA1 family)